MYRAVTCAYLDAGVAPDDESGVIAATTAAVLEISTDAANQWVRVNGADVTLRIREPAISANVSAVSTVTECRATWCRDNARSSTQLGRESWPKVATSRPSLPRTRTSACC